jgi:hypothetical protein
VNFFFIKNCLLTQTFVCLAKGQYGYNQSGRFFQEIDQSFFTIVAKRVNVPGNQLFSNGSTFSIQKYLVVTPGTIEQKFTDHSSQERSKVSGAGSGSNHPKSGFLKSSAQPPF